MNTQEAGFESKCHNCSSANLRRAEGYDTARRVTSDCKPWGPGGILALCMDCGLVQTLVTPQWEQDCRRIYEGYSIYYQSNGAEQRTFVGDSGASRSRSDALLGALVRRQILPGTGRWLDVGCGNGALLSACSRVLSEGWQLFGSEVSDKHREQVESIETVERLYSCPVEEIPGSFEVISLIHVIEHIPAPSHYLRIMASKLSSGGLLLLQVPDCSQNPFALMIADHCSHFSPGTLSRVASDASYEILEVANNWVSKEISLIATASSEKRDVPAMRPDESEAVLGGWDVLQRLAEKVKALAVSREPFGIFGTSIGATWLDAQIGQVGAFFVDEDPARIGKLHLGRPVLSSQAVPKGATVVLALAPVVAEQVRNRLQMTRPGVKVISP